MAYSNLSFKIYIEAPESDLVIQDLDIEFKVNKSIKADADSAHIVIWNLDESSYKLLIHKNQPIYLYTKVGNEDAKLLFVGYTDANFITRKLYSVLKTNNEAAPPDIRTTIKLVESRLAYQNAYINENYRDSVSAEQIINDCISAMKLGSVMINTKIPEKIYSSYKALGKPHDILTNVCNSLGVDVVIQNGIVNIGTPSTNNTENDAVVLSEYNCLEPQYQNNNEILLISFYNPEISPNSIVNCQFEDFNGAYRVLDVVFEGNNFDKASTTYITIGLNI